jgi:carnitine O-acetyltransferase
MRKKTYGARIKKKKKKKVSMSQVLPLPSLEATCERYKAQALALGCNEATVCRDMEELLSPAGRRLHDYLVARCHEMSLRNESWLEEWWYRSYFEWRVPVALCSNVWLGIAWPSNLAAFDEILRARKFRRQSMRAASLVCALLGWRRHFESGLMEPLKSRDGTLLDCSQRERVFGTCRLPGEQCDRLRFAEPEQSRHVLVAWRRRFYVLRGDDNDALLSLDCVAAALDALVAADRDDSDERCADDVGILTTLGRTEWARARCALIDAHADNASNVDTIERAAFVLCLDDCAASSDQAMGELAFHGGGGGGEHSANRYFDKSMQIVVDRSGRAAANFEHSWGDGILFAHLIDDAHARADTLIEEARQPSAASARIHVSTLRWRRVDKARVDSARALFASRVADNTMRQVHFGEFGRARLKQIGAHPDAFMQLAMQLAYARVNGGKATAVYESVATLKFVHGRTETARSCTAESRRFVETMLDDEQFGDDARREAYACAQRKHVSIMRDASNGLGCDRHLFGLQCAARELGVAAPSLFASAHYVRSTTFHLSTSQNVPRRVFGFGFAEQTESGYGVPYSVMHSERLYFSVSSRRGVDETERMCSSIVEAFRRVERLLSSKTQHASKL